jgi:acyl carrier protein
LKKKLIKIIADVLKTDDQSISESSDFEKDLGFDSLDFVEIVIAIEKAFSIEIYDEDVLNIKTIKMALEYLEKR